MRCDRTRSLLKFKLFISYTNVNTGNYPVTLINTTLVPACKFRIISLKLFCLEKHHEETSRKVINSRWNDNRQNDNRLNNKRRNRKHRNVKQRNGKRQNVKRRQKIERKSGGNGSLRFARPQVSAEK